jgi:hypothetical protein
VSATTESATTKQEVASYTYGIVRASTQIPEDSQGVGEPPGRVRLVTHGSIAALTSDVRLDRPLGTREDLLAHESLLDALVEQGPVLPFRLGAAVTNDQAVIDELLDPNHDDFASALDDLEGRAQFSVKARYEQDVVLREVLEEEPEIRRLQESVRNTPEDAAYNDRVRLGELTYKAMERKRELDGKALFDALAPYAASGALREAPREEGVVDGVFLVEDQRRSEFEAAVDDLGRQWASRIRLRLLGPLAPYDFVQTTRRG